MSDKKGWRNSISKPQTGKSLRGIRDGFGEGIVEVGKKNKKVVCLVADLGSSTRAEKFGAKYPSRYFQVGIAEQHMMSAAAGMAVVGKIPFINSFAVFSPGRNWDQLRVSVCYSNLNVKVHASHAGITVGEDGATHQALEDLAITRVLPNLSVIVPADATEAKQATLAITEHKGPVYLRTSRAKTTQVTKDEPFVIGKAKKMSYGKDVTIVACGVMVEQALFAAEELKKENISVEILNCASIKPFDEKALLQSVRKTGCIVTAEEHQIHGGLGSLVSEIITQSDTLVPIEMVGMKDCFGESGTAEQLLKKYEMDSDTIVKAVKKVLKRKS